MAINIDLLVAAPMLQDALIDKDGTPLAGGIVTCFQDTARTTLKNWYYQSGVPGSYTYIALPNPLTLSSSGTICDSNGVDTIPFFYPYSEADESIQQPYYITITNSQYTNLVTRANFPYIPTNSSDTSNLSYENYIVNNVFWKNPGLVNLSAATQQVVCLSQHNGFSMPDMQFFKNVTGATDIATFSQFALSATPQITTEPTPEYYLNHACTGPTTGETEKYYQIPISLHVRTLNSVDVTFSIQTQWVNGSQSLTLSVLQDLGTGASGSVVLPVTTISTTSAWQRTIVSFTMPSTAGLALSSSNDDAFYLQIGLPVNAAFSINFTKPSMYIGTNAPSNNFSTYDEIDIAISRPGEVFYLTSSGTYTPSMGVTSILVEALSAGGGGGGAQTTTSSTTTAGAGGGGGCYSRKYYSIVPTSAAYIIGSGGAGGVGASSTAGGSGGATSFNTIATTATAGSTTTLTSSSTQIQYFTGTLTQTVLLPVTSTLSVGQFFAIVNNSTGDVTVQSSGANTLQVMATNTQLIATVISTSGTTTASWSWVYGEQTVVTADINLLGGSGGASSGANVAATSTSSSIGGAGGVAGSGDTSDLVILGSRGSNGIILLGLGQGFTGIGGTAGNGSAGGNSVNFTGNGNTASGYGGGGGGAGLTNTFGTANGGAGAGGLIIIHEYYDPVIS